jgi:hypothetical protein
MKSEYLLDNSSKSIINTEKKCLIEARLGGSHLQSQLLVRQKPGRLVFKATVHAKIL